MSETPLREPESPDDLAEILSSAAPSGTFEVELPGGRTIECRYPTRYGEVRLFWRSLVEFWEAWKHPDQLLDALRPYAPRDWSEAYAAYLLYFWAADSNRFSARAALSLNRNAWLMDSIKNQIEASQRTLVDVAALEEISAAKKGSTETTSTESGSGSAETPSASTPTS